MLMVTTPRTQNRYDHRLRQLVRTTQDVSYAVQCGVPRSTARGWLSAPSVEVVTLNSLNMDATELQREVLRLQTRIQKLITLLRVLLVVLKISRFSLNQARFPDGNDNRSRQGSHRNPLACGVADGVRPQWRHLAQKIPQCCDRQLCRLSLRERT